MWHLLRIEDRSLRLVGYATHVAGAVGAMLIGVAGWCVCGHLTSQTVHARQACELALVDVAGEEHARTQLKKLTERFHAENKRLQQISSMLPVTPEETSFLAELATLQEELEVAAYRPSGVTALSNHKELLLGLTGTTSYEGLCRFLDRLDALPRYCRVAKMSISGGEEPAEYRVELDLGLAFGATVAQQGTGHAIK